MIKTILQTFICVGLMLLYDSARAEKPWHDHAVRAYAGYVENAAIRDPHGIYERLRLGSAAEVGAAFVIVMNRSFDLDIALSRMRVEGRQRGISEHDGSMLDINMTITKLLITGKLRYNKHEGSFVPWLGIGFDGALMDCDEWEQVSLDGGRLIYKRRRVSSAVGGHVSAGMDIYPIRTSSLALTMETRYQINAMINGPFQGNLDGIAFLMGVKWDFWPRTDYRFK